MTETALGVVKAESFQVPALIATSSRFAKSFKPCPRISSLVPVTMRLARDTDGKGREPTSAIGEHETHLLFNAIRRLTSLGKGIIYVSHRMTEIFEIADDYTVFRDGAYVDSGRIEAIDRHHLIRQIIGRELNNEFRAGAVSAEPKNPQWRPP